MVTRSSIGKAEMKPYLFKEEFLVSGVANLACYTREWVFWRIQMVILSLSFGGWKRYRGCLI